jgi:hypothetical protein
VDQEFLGPFNPALHEPSVSRDPESRLEGPGKVADRKAALLCHLREPYSPRQILAQQLRRPAFLPRPQAADRDRRRFSQSYIVLEQMRAEDQINSALASAGIALAQDRALSRRSEKLSALVEIRQEC